MGRGCRESVLQVQDGAFGRVLHAVVEDVERGHGNLLQAALEAQARVQLLLVNPREVHQAAQRHVLVYRALVLAEHDDAVVHEHGHVVVLPTEEHVLYANVFERRGFWRERRAVQGVVQRKKVLLAVAVVAEEVYEHAVLVGAVGGIWHGFSLRVVCGRFRAGNALTYIYAEKCLKFHFLQKIKVKKCKNIAAAFYFFKILLKNYKNNSLLFNTAPCSNMCFTAARPSARQSNPQAW